MVMQRSVDNPVDRECPEGRDRLHAELREVELALAVGDTASLLSAVRRLDDLERWLDGHPGKGGADWSEMASSVATARGHVERLHYRVDEASTAYEEALVHLGGSGLDPLRTARRSANLRTYLGLTRLLGHRPEDWAGAAAHFEESIRLREADPEPDETLRWGLSAAWINRGDALARLGGDDRIEEAIRSYEKASALLADFDLAASPAHRSRLALCHLNLGAAKTELAVRYASGGREEAFAHYEQAAAILRPGAEGGIEESKRMLAVALVNTSRARMIHESADPSTSESEAREALRWIGTGDRDETDDWEMLNLELTARLTLCLALREQDDGPASADEITDLAEDGLRRLRRHLAIGGVLDPLDAVAGQLFGLGAETYARHLPRFLGDYLLDHLDPERDSSGLERSAACHEAAVETLWRAIGDLKREGFTGIGTEAYERRVELEIEWDRCRERLAEIRTGHFEF